MLSRVQALIEGCALLLRVVFAVAFIPRASTPSRVVILFSIAQLLHSGGTVVAYAGVLGWRNLIPNPRKGLDSATASLAFSFVKQSTLSQILAEGERYVLSFVSVVTLAEQGVYSVVDALGYVEIFARN